MNPRSRYLPALPLGLLFAAATHGMVASEREKAATRSWVDAHLLAADAEPPFTLTCGGKPFNAIRRHCALRREDRALADGRTEHTLTWSDPETHLEVRCVAIAWADHAAVEWMLHLRNGGSAPSPILEAIRPLDAVMMPAPAPCTLHYTLGDSNSADSFAPREKAFAAGDTTPFTLAPQGGRSSDAFLPFFNLAGTEGGTAIAVGWSGQWEARFERSADGLHARAGQQLTHLSLQPGETIRTPRILLVFWKGTQTLRGNNLLRSILIDHYLPRRDGKPVWPPICASVNWTAPDGTYEGPHIEVLQPLAERGIEVLWSDMDPQQWYPGGFPEGTGTWEVDPAKYPQGLKPIGDAVAKAGMQYLLWFEPERVHPGTKIDREHGEWVIKPQGEWSQLFRLHDPQARRWITDRVDRHVKEAGLSWIRWDFNIDPLGFWRRNDAPDRQGMTEIRHVEGLYAMWDDLRARRPGLVIDNCASGGRRIDLETCIRSIPLWHSDSQCSGKPDPVTDQLQNAGLYRWIPMHGCGNFAYEPTYEFRSAMTAGNILAHGNTRGRLDAADPDTAPAVTRTVAIYRKLRPYTLGDFYPLFPHLKNQDVWFGYQFHRADQQAGVAIVYRRAACHTPSALLQLNDVDESGRYEVICEDKPERSVVNGSDLVAWNVRIEDRPGSAILYYRKVNQ
ncbi:MAG TPA: alpha-galactosidase [Phycisphaerae bacterium]|nr:alpha-galactosidase [Phycisphaerae bacterium]HRY68213.1 alpha-galactosidase [Phycisphaerae bacterium]HSA28604.1 alpha-galactosidase [Phycisphaerae bacterium]